LKTDDPRIANVGPGDVLIVNERGDMAKDSTGTILLLGGVGALAYGYYAGWFAQFGLGPIASPAAVPASTPAASTVPAPVPALGTVVHTTADALAQIKANDAFILPDAATFAALSGATSYQPITTTDNGQILLRPDVNSAVQSVISGRVARASTEGAATQSIQNAGQVTLAQIQQMMTNSGLSGLGDFARHMFTRTGRYA
jgi:hypothetical protein